MTTGRIILAFSLLAVLAAAPPVCAAGAPRIHPAVARVMVAESDGTSFGSATLVAVGDNYGLMVTNWHVVRDSNGFVVVSFPDGFRSTATVLRVDRDWDLAALAIRKPNAQPVPLAQDAPRPGDPLIIAGYGKGSYRTAAGRCTQYVSPGGLNSFEMIELDASARQGDSGGPIFNARGELAGVLFGSGWGKTAGSYAGRVRDFLFPAWEAMQRLPAPAFENVAQSGPAAAGNVAQPPSAARNVAQPPSAVFARAAQSPATMPSNGSPGQDGSRRLFPVEPNAAGGNPGIARAPTAEASPWPGPEAAVAVDQARPGGAAGANVSASLQTTAPKEAAELVSGGNGEMLRNLLAIIGAVLLAFGGLRILAKAA